MHGRRKNQARGGAGGPAPTGGGDSSRGNRAAPGEHAGDAQVLVQIRPVQADAAKFDILLLLLGRPSNPGIPGERRGYRAAVGQFDDQARLGERHRDRSDILMSITKEVIPSLSESRLLRAHDAHDLVQLAGSVPHTDGNAQIVQPNLGFVIALPDVYVRGFLALVRVEEEAIAPMPEDRRHGRVH